MIEENKLEFECIQGNNYRIYVDMEKLLEKRVLSVLPEIDDEEKLIFTNDYLHSREGLLNELGDNVNSRTSGSSIAQDILKEVEHIILKYIPFEQAKNRMNMLVLLDFREFDDIMDIRTIGLISKIVYSSDKIKETSRTKMAPVWNRVTVEYPGNHLEGFEFTLQIYAKASEKHKVIVREASVELEKGSTKATDTKTGEEYASKLSVIEDSFARENENYLRRFDGNVFYKVNYVKEEMNIHNISREDLLDIVNRKKTLKLNLKLSNKITSHVTINLDLLDLFKLLYRLDSHWLSLCKKFNIPLEPYQTIFDFNVDINILQCTPKSLNTSDGNYSDSNYMTIADSSILFISLLIHYQKRIYSLFPNIIGRSDYDNPEYDKRLKEEKINELSQLRYYTEHQIDNLINIYKRNNFNDKEKIEIVKAGLSTIPLIEKSIIKDLGKDNYDLQDVLLSELFHKEYRTGDLVLCRIVDNRTLISKLKFKDIDKDGPVVWPNSLKSIDDSHFLLAQVKEHKIDRIVFYLVSIETTIVLGEVSMKYRDIYNLQHIKIFKETGEVDSNTTKNLIVAGHHTSQKHLPSRRQINFYTNLIERYKNSCTLINGKDVPVVSSHTNQLESTNTWWYLRELPIAYKPHMRYTKLDSMKDSHFSEIIKTNLKNSIKDSKERGLLSQNTLPNKVKNKILRTLLKSDISDSNSLRKVIEKTIINHVIGFDISVYLLQDILQDNSLKDCIKETMVEDILGDIMRERK